MEGQTNCALCEYKSRSTGSLKQHMETKHNVFNMTMVQVLTQQESLEEKEKACDDLITLQKEKAVEESMLVEELKLTKGLLDKAHQDLETKTND